MAPMRRFLSNYFDLLFTFLNIRLWALYTIYCDHQRATLQRFGGVCALWAHLSVLKMGQLRRYSTPALLQPAWNHTAMHFFMTTAIQVCCNDKKKQFCCHQRVFRAQNITHVPCVCGRGLLPQTQMVELSHSVPPDPLAGSRGRKGKEREGTKGEGEE